MATAADWMSAASFISMAGLISFFGYGGSVFLMGWTGGYVLLALLLAPYLRKHGTFTVPEFISDRYYTPQRFFASFNAAVKPRNEKVSFVLVPRVLSALIIAVDPRVIDTLIFVSISEFAGQAKPPSGIKSYFADPICNSTI